MAHFRRIRALRRMKTSSFGLRIDTSRKLTLLTLLKCFCLFFFFFLLVTELQKCSKYFIWCFQKKASLSVPNLSHQKLSITKGQRKSVFNQFLLKVPKGRKYSREKGNGTFPLYKPSSKPCIVAHLSPMCLDCPVSPGLSNTSALLHRSSQKGQQNIHIPKGESPGSGAHSGTQNGCPEKGITLLNDDFHPFRAGIICTFRSFLPLE